MKIIKILAIAGIIMLVSSCAKNESVAPVGHNIENGALCEVNSWSHDDVAAKCKPGQKVVYLPESFGNEQLPVIFSAVNCDLRYAVALTRGAVTCVYGPITPTKAKSAGNAPTEKP